MEAAIQHFFMTKGANRQATIAGESAPFVMFAEPFRMMA